MPQIERRPGRRVAFGAGALIMCLGLLLSGCSGTADTNTAQDAQKITLPDTPAGEESQWVIDELNASGELKVEDWEGKLSDTITQVMPAEELLKQIDSDVRKKSPFVPTKFQETDNVATTRIVGLDKTRFDMVLSFDDSGKFDGIHFNPVA